MRARATGTMTSTSARAAAGAEVRMPRAAAHASRSSVATKNVTTITPGARMVAVAVGVTATDQTGW